MTLAQSDHQANLRLVRAAFVLGLALSGFFDGILLHQILQWHHFLSLVPGESFRELRTQILADGLFHVFVYLLTALGLFLLWRARGCLSSSSAGRDVAGGALLGFGVWNVVDVGFFHWILGVHRIRVNVPNPLFYDLIWFVGLGLIVALIGAWVLRRTPFAGGRRAALGLVILLSLGTPVANLPIENSNTLVVLRDEGQLAQAINATVAVNGRIVVADPGTQLLIVKLPQEASRAGFYRAGALLVTSSPTLSGCLAFTDII